MAIALLLLLVLRSWRLTLLVLTPLGLAALLTVAATVVFSLPFNFANVIVLPLLFGLGVAAGIHIVARERQERSADLSATSTPRAVLFSALTTIGSFGALALSSHQGNGQHGRAADPLDRHLAGHHAGRAAGAPGALRAPGRCASAGINPPSKGSSGMGSGDLT